MFNFFSRKKPKIKFMCKKNWVDALPHPVPAAKAMPEWFKKLGRDVPSKKELTQVGTIKRCMPVLDAVSQGFIIPLWADLHIKIVETHELFNENGDVITQLNIEGDPADAIGKEAEGQVIASTKKTGLFIWAKFPEGYRDGGVNTHTWEQVGELCDLKKFELGQVLLKLDNPWAIETPKGWAVQFKNPANNWSNDLHFLEGVVDTDEYISPVNFPFVWTGKEAGEWIIPRGTPIIQVIPFKREKIDLAVGEMDMDKFENNHAKMQVFFTDRYRRLFWHKRRDAKLD